MKLDEREEGDDRLEVVAISDVHVHPWSAFSSGTGLNNSRLQQTLSVLRASLQEAKERDNLWLCGGDIVDTAGHMQNVVANAVIETLNEFPGVRKYIIFGNHDSRGRGSTAVDPSETATAAIAEAVENMYMLHQEEVETREGLTIYGEGAQPKAQHYMFLDGDVGADIGLFHFIVDGSQAPSGYDLSGEVKPEELLDRFRCSIVGDVHHPTHWWVDGNLILVPGSPEHHNFGDSGERGYWVLPFERGPEPGEWVPLVDEVEMIPSDSPKFITVEDPVQVEDDNNFYRIKGTNVRPEDVPEGVKTVGSPPSTVESRDALRGASSGREILERWMDETPPDEDLDEEDLLRAGLELVSDVGGVQIKPTTVVNVHAENFFSYKEFKWDLEDGVHLIVGESNDFDSNGAGKSTLLEAIYWALFGKTTKGVSAGDEIRWGADSCRVSAALMVEDQSCLVERRRGGSGPELDISIDGEPVGGSSVREVQSNFMDWLGISEDVVRALSYFSQEDVLLFSRSTDAERKALLSDLCGLGAYDDAASDASSEASSYEERASKAEQAIDQATSSLDRLKERRKDRQDKHQAFEDRRTERLEEVEAALDEIEDANPEDRLYDRLQEIMSRAKDLKEQFAEIREQEAREQVSAEMEEKRENLQGRIEDVEADIEEIDAALSELPEPTEGAVKEAKKAASEAAKKLENLKFTKQRREADLEHLQGELSDLDEMEDDEFVCPRCHQEVSDEHLDEMRAEIQEGIDGLQSDIEGLEELIEVAEEGEEENNEHLERIRRAQQLEESRAEKEERLSELQSSLEDVASLEEERVQRFASDWFGHDEDRIESRVARAEDYVEQRVEEHQDQVDAARSMKEEWASKENPHKGALEELKQEIDTIREEIEEHGGRAEKARYKARLYEYWSEGFSKRGIQSLLLEEIAALFNQYRDRVFPLLTRGKYDVQFQTMSETQAGEKREKTEFIVRDRGAQVPYDNLSGGQRRRVDLGVMLTLAMANAEMRGVPGILGMIMLDECADHLDAEGVEALAETLKVEVSDVIPRIYVVSQDTEMKSLFPSVVEVYQDESGVSHLVGGLRWT